MGERDRNWAMVFLLIMCVGAGTTGLVHPVGTDVATTFPGWAKYAWFAGLIIFAVIALAGIARRNLNGLYAERTAQLGLAGLCFGYTTTATILCLIKDGISAYSTTLVFAFGILCIIRVWQIHRQIRTIHADLKRLTASTPGAPT